MYCPQCGTESQTTQYCRTCGANLKVIGKAVALSEAVARSDRGPLPKIKEMIGNFKVDHVSDEVSGALDRMNQEIARISPEAELRAHRRSWIEFPKRKTPAKSSSNTSPWMNLIALSRNFNKFTYLNLLMLAGALLQ